MLSPSVSAPLHPTPAETIAEAIEHIGPLHGLSLEDRLWLARNGEERIASAGEVLFEEGTPAEHMMLILKGEIHVRRQRTGPMSLFIGRSGQMTGLLPFSRMKAYGGQGFATNDVWALLVHHSLFPEMLDAIPSMAQRSVTTLLDRVREVTRMEQQAEKLNALGKLAGNLAHELNNPASAAQRAASGLHQELRANRQNRFQLINLCLTDEQITAVEAWELKVLTGPGHSPDAPETKPAPVAFLAREESIRAWLAALGCPEPWDVAAPLAEQGVTVDQLNQLRAVLPSDATCISLQFFARYLRSSRSVDTLLSSTERIFDLISAVKDYSFMDRAPILEVDVPAGLDATLQMFQSRMTHVQVTRDYEPDLPTISAYGSELNQVWTALIENALDALGTGVPTDTGSPASGPGSLGWRDRPSSVGWGYQGELRLTCRQETDMLLVEIWDTGPGIPAELQDRIFEPFFTTKAPGQGLGLGLDNAMRIVRKHRGHISVISEPGSTCFRVRLPLDQLQAY